MAVYPWDLLDEGLDAGLDRLRGELGIDHLAFWAATPPTAQFRPRRTEPRFFCTGGGLMFRPDLQRYRATRIKPVASSWLKGKDRIAALAQACEARSMGISAIVSASRVGQVAQRHPETACKNAFGDVSHAALCLVNADVQGYLCSVVADIASRGWVEAIELTDFVVQWSQAWTVELPLMDSNNDAARSLLAFCFCESCRRRAAAAGVDIESAARFVCVTLQRWFDAGGAAGADEDLAGLIAEHPPFKAYCDWRAGELASLLAQIARASACPIVLVRSASDDERIQHQALDYSLTNGVVTKVYSDEAVEAARCRDAARSYAALPASAPAMAQTSKLVSLFSKAAEAGLSGIQIDHYGALAEPMLTSLRQAIRYARRLQANPAEA